MTTPVKVFEPDIDSTDPGDNLIHMVCTPCIEAERRPLLAWCGTDVTDDPMVQAKDYGPEDCAMCVLAHANYRCPMCKRKALP